jgi:asparaginyl-tRNA synthetase
MIKKQFIQELMDKCEKEGEISAEVYGWVWRERGSAQVKFVVLRDNTNVLQCVIEKAKIGDEKFSIADKIQVETAMKIVGKIRKEPRAPSGYEVNASSFEVIGEAVNYPITKDFSTEFLLDNRHLWVRSRRMIAILKIRSTVFGAIHEYFRTNDFFEHHSPCFTANAAEGGSTLFKVDYFGKPMFLTQTWQLYAEAVVYALEKIYCIAPSFRAERSKTSRHLTEYWHAEMEMAWCEFDDILKHGEGLIKHVFKRVLEKNLPELELLKRDVSKLKKVVEKPFIRMTYDDALKILKEKCKMDVPWGKDLRTIEEDELTKQFDVPLMVTNYPKIIKAFYMKEDASNPSTVLGVDFLAPDGYGEVIGGSQREENQEKIEERLRDQGEKPELYGWYMDLRKYGSVPHGGFGLGVERIISWVCGLDNIKDAIAFPRTMLRYTP